MTLCPRCGVELEDGEPSCPLCGLAPDAAAGDDARAEAPAGTQPGPPSSEQSAMKRRVHRWLLEIYSLLAAAAALVLFVADFSSGMSLTWARYPLVSLAFLWLAMLLLIVGARRPWVWLPAQVLAVGAFLYVLDAFTAGAPWFSTLALPAVLTAGAILALTLAIVRIGRLAPFAAVAVALLAAGVFVVALELLLNRHLAGRWSVSWSVIALACTLPPVLILFYLRRRFRSRQEEIRKVLHL